MSISEKLIGAVVVLVVAVAVVVSCRGSASTTDYISVLPGLGTEQVQVNMPADQLPKSFVGPQKESGVPLHIVSRYSDLAKGVTVVCYEDRVWHATFYLRPGTWGRKHYSAFPGIVDDAITYQSSIEDIIAEFGEPSTHESAADSTYLDFGEKGIEFRFKGDNLQSVTVDDPTFNTDEIYEKIRDYRAKNPKENED
ncbi:hypothetical protein [Aeoliella sp.]|uniref:hypothetical protein n=1 Tax=Aeoliella sp. TaxID=2795800 RepID=UPI003CCBED84